MDSKFLEMASWGVFADYVGIDEFKRALWGDNPPINSVVEVFYEDYVASKLTICEYKIAIEATRYTPTIDSDA